MLSAFAGPLQLTIPIFTTIFMKEILLMKLNQGTRRCIPSDTEDAETSSRGNRGVCHAGTLLTLLDYLLVVAKELLNPNFSR
jgi:hypothetical protein